MTELRPLDRLASGTDPFLAPHHLAAAAKLEALVRRASLSPRLTMSYEGVSVASGGLNPVADVTESAAEARQKIGNLSRTLPHDCWQVVFDVCALGLGLQEVEASRRWPRRSAKLVLRIGLEQLAREFGLAPHVAGSHGGGVRGWIEQRPPMFVDAQAQ